nr:bacteriocin class II family protein [Streptococcus equi]
MNMTLMKQFNIIDTDKLAHIEGGKNNWQANVWEGGTAAVSGWGLGTAVCGYLAYKASS